LTIILIYNIFCKMKKKILEILSDLVGKWLDKIESNCKAQEEKNPELNKFIDEQLELDKKINEALCMSSPDEIKNPKRFFII